MIKHCILSNLWDKGWCDGWGGGTGEIPEQCGRADGGRAVMVVAMEESENGMLEC